MLLYTVVCCIIYIIFIKLNLFLIAYKMLFQLLGFFLACSTLTVYAENTAVVNIQNNGTSNVSGLVYFNETSDGILITGTIKGLEPGLHGFHVHIYGDLSNGCLSTGAHFNPTNVSHGGPNDSVRHIGDLGNIEANKDGIATLNFTDKIITLSGANNIVGRGVVVHEGEDDLGKGDFEDSKTTGHALSRVGCGVIGTL
ncbi:hypothetical protein ABEB36_014254 [Hypothenemus hampei]